MEGARTFHATASGKPKDTLDNPLTSALDRLGQLEGRRMFKIAGPSFPNEIVTSPEDYWAGMRIDWTFIKRDIFGYTQEYLIDGPASTPKNNQS